MKWLTMGCTKDAKNIAGIWGLSGVPKLLVHHQSSNRCRRTTFYETQRNGAREQVCEHERDVQFEAQLQLTGLRVRHRHRGTRSRSRESTLQTLATATHGGEV